MDVVKINSLKSNLKYLGFGNSLTPALEARIKEGADKFSIGATAQFDNEGSIQGKSPKDIVHYELLFSKSEFNKNYFIHGFKAALEKGSTKEKIINTFYLGRGNDVTAKEAYNLLSGRSILKAVEISKQYDLQFIDNQGLIVEESKIAGIQEAKDFLSSKVDKDSHQQGYFQILDNGQLIRQMDLQGKDITPKPSGKVVLVHDYYNKGDGTLNKSHYSVKNKEEAVHAIHKLLDDHHPDQETNGFRIYESSGKFLLYNFDRQGQEIDISLNKRKENVWVKLDFTEKDKAGNYGFEKFYGDHGFNLEKELSLLGIRGLSNDKERKILLASLGRGNIERATLESGNKVYLKADPQSKRMEVYDQQFNKINQSSENKDQGLRR